jgi:hypothetical protein
MAYKVEAVTYTGATFRGMRDETDDRLVVLTFADDIVEQEVVAFLLDEFSYGSDDEEMDIAAYVAGLNSGDTAQGDGCGLVYKLWQDGKLLYDFNADDAEAEAAMQEEKKFDITVTRANLGENVAAALHKLYKLKNVFECGEEDYGKKE